MDLLFEFIFDLIFEFNEEAAKSKKLSKWIRYPLLFVLGLFYLFVIGLIFYLAYAFKSELLLCLIFVALGILFLLLTIKKFRNEYLSRNRESIIDEIIK